MPNFLSDLTNAVDTGYVVSLLVNKAFQRKQGLPQKPAKAKSKLLLYYQEIILKS